LTTLDYEVVSRYWSTAASSILGPYMMDGFGFPAGAGRFRFRAECRIVDRLIDGQSPDGCLLDLGSGIGFWAEYFAQRFSQVVAVEASKPLYEALERRCAPYANVKLVHGDAMRFPRKDQYDVVFLGGLLMYLNDEDVISLLGELISCLRPGGVVMCRETTVRQRTTTRQGDYQAVYRSVADYQRIFAACELSVHNVQLNTPYVLLQMGCEFIKRWKTLIPAPFQCIPVVGRPVYWGMRLGYPWITCVPTALGLAYPELTNHFFVLQPDLHQHPTVAHQTTPSRKWLGAHSEIVDARTTA
jgi:SAM-dependent methyltransferase